MSAATTTSRTGQPSTREAPRGDRTGVKNAYEMVLPYGIWLMVLASLIPWRRDAFFSGSIDPVVISKAVLGVAAFLLALFVPGHESAKARVGFVGIAIVFFYCALSTAGGYAADSTIPALVIAVRLILLATTVLLVVHHFRAPVVLRSLLGSMALVGGIGALLGAGRVFSGRRLATDLPALNPNDLALLCAVPAIGLVYEMTTGRRSWTLRLPLLVALVGAVWLTGSRTGLFAMVVGIVFVILSSGRARIRTIVCAIASVPVTFAILAYTNTLASVIVRDGATQADLVTLTARTTAWQAVLNTPNDTWRRWIGSGLDLRQVKVSGQYWEQQVIDSSWISSLAQAGVIGVVLLATLTLLTVVWSVRARTLRGFTTPLLAFILIRSFLESGLLDVYVTFVVFFTLSALCDIDARTASRQQIYNRNFNAMPLRI
jgi:hypothetical protein